MNEICLPQDKLLRLRETVASWLRRKACTKCELLSLIGQLDHACIVVKPGRSFLCRLIQLSTQVHLLNHFVRLNTNARADLGWWNAFLSDWNGRSFLSLLGQQKPDIVVQSDASGNWGCGAVVLETRNWFQL